MNKTFLTIFSLLFWCNMNYAQDSFTVSGTIYDSENGETLIGTTIAVKELVATGTISNAYGFYSLTLPKGNYTLVVSFIGYEHQEIPVSHTSNQRFDVKLSPDAQLINEVVISAKKKNDNITSEKVGVEKINTKEIEKIPVLFGEKDIIKTLTLTPGVKTTSEGSGGMFVRGGNNSQNLILLDEATVYNSNHMMGFFSTFNSDAIKDLTMYKGTAPSEYGGRISSVMDIKMNDGNNQDYHIGGGIGLISSKLSLEGPIVKDKGSFLVTGRRTYADMFLKLSSDDDLNNNRLYFYDLNLKANYKVNDNNRVFLSGYFGRDVLSADELFGMDWGNATGTFRWNHIWNSKLFSNTSVIYSQYDYDVNLNFSDNNMGFLSEINNLTVKQDFQYFMSNRNSLSFGVYFQDNTILPGQLELEDESEIKPTEIQERYNLEYGGYISDTWKPNDKLTLTGGLRLNIFNLIGPGDFYSYSNAVITDTATYASGELVQSYINLEPRANIAYAFNSSNSVKLSYTRNTQNLHLIQNSTTSGPTDIWIASSNNIKPEIGDQVSMGYFKNLKDNQYQLSGEMYYKKMYNQIDLRDGADMQANEHIEGELLFGSGRAYGLELMLRKKHGKLTGWASYTLSRTEKQIDGINNGDWYAARQDATHDISIVGMYSLSPKWTISATWVYNTGNAVTFPSGKYEADGETHLLYTERNGYRMPAYHRLDLGATCELKKSEKFESSLSFSLYNAYGRKNPYMINFAEDENDPSRTVATKTYLFTFVPSISYNFKF